MGTITRSFANNITTSGVLLPASLDNNSIANVTEYNASISTGTMKLISSQTANNSASISFTSGINSTYKEYQFVFVNIYARTYADDFQINFSTDGGSNYNVAKTNSYVVAYHGEGGAGGVLAFDSGRESSQVTGFINFYHDSGNDSDDNACGSLTLFNPASTTYVKQYIPHFSNFYITGYSFQVFTPAYANTTSAINAVQFKMASGNFDGTILMYGIV
jgi:hypothetical protein